MQTLGRAFSFLIGLCALSSCAPSTQRLELLVRAEDRAVIDDFVGLLPEVPIEVRTSTDPASEAGSGDGVVRAALVTERLTGAEPCAGCYRVDRQDGGGFVVRGSDTLGVQYGLAQLLEATGIRFFHPSRTHVPEGMLSRELDESGFGRLMKPDKSLRGLHLHTLHPIEAYYDLWEPGEENLKRAYRLVDWIVKNRGNYIQWVALDDILEPGHDVPWRAHTRAILDYAHRRGLKTGIGIQLFGFSSLQHGYDLVDDKNAPPEGQIRARYRVLLDGLRFDKISMSFGEFVGTDPKQFIDTVNLSYKILQEIAPGTEMSATVHVGDSPKQKVEYMGEKMIYYFLVKYADPAIIPWIHTVMYYDLFEDAGGAYHHNDFAAHREYLLSRVREGKRVGYKPETAYWIAFDNSVPTYLPLYIRSRWLDLAEVRRAVPGKEMPEHVLFSSGWEWGYWQNDYTSLRMSYTLPEQWGQLVTEMFAPFGEKGQAIAAQVTRLGDLQNDALIKKRLAPYLAGRDLYLDGGREADIISQPDRPSLAEIAMADPAGQARFADTVLQPLERFADDLAGIRAAIDAIAASGELSPFLVEIQDGAAVTALRARYIHAIYRAALEAARGGDTAPWMQRADETLEAARVIVERRKGSLLLGGAAGERLSANDSNATIYSFGYLKQGHNLCFWERERIQLRKQLLGASVPISSCIL
jgi:hypothetical protein